MADLSSVGKLEALQEEERVSIKPDEALVTEIRGAADFGTQCHTVNAVDSIKIRSVQKHRDYAVASLGSEAEQLQQPGMNNTGIASTHGWSLPKSQALKMQAKFSRGCNEREMKALLAAIPGVIEVIRVTDTGHAIVRTQSVLDSQRLFYALPLPRLDTAKGVIMFQFDQPAALAETAVPFHTLHFVTPDDSPFRRPTLGWLSLAAMLDSAAADGLIPEFVSGGKSRPGSKVISLTFLSYDAVESIQASGGVLDRADNMLLPIATPADVESDISIGISLEWSLVTNFPAGTKPAAASEALNNVCDAAGFPKGGDHRKVMVLWGGQGRGIYMRLIAPGRTEFLAVLGQVTRFENTVLVFTASERSKVGATPPSTDPKLIVGRVQQALAEGKRYDELFPADSAAKRVTGRQQAPKDTGRPVLQDPGPTAPALPAEAILQLLHTALAGYSGGDGMGGPGRHKRRLEQQ